MFHLKGKYSKKRSQLQIYFARTALGATSGRTILGRIGTPCQDGDQIKIDYNSVSLEEVTRFPNRLIQQGGHFYWDIFAL